MNPGMLAAATLNSGGNNGGFRTEPGEHVVPLASGQHPPPVVFDCKQSGEGGEVSPPLRALSHDKSHANAGGQLAVAFSTKESGKDATEGITPPLRAESGDPHMGGRMAAAYQCHGTNVGEMGTVRSGNQGVTGGVPFVVSGRDRGDDGRGYAREPHISDLPQVDATKPDRVVAGMAVRRLTPTECARLQGFPDDYLSQVTYRGKCPPADGPMYKALGNSMAVPVMRWIGERIAAVELLSQQSPTS